MRPRSASADIIVIGAGISGAFTAFLAARRGLRTVLIDRDPVASHASGHNPGGLNPLHGPGIPGPMQTLALQAFHLHLRNWETIGRLSGIAFAGRRISRIFLALESEDRAAMNTARLHYEATPGFSAHWLDRAQLRAIESRLNPAAFGGLLTNGNATVDAHAYTRAVVEAAVRLGAMLVHGEVTNIIRTGSRVEAVVLDKEQFSCGFLVIATGPWVEGPSRWLDMEVPVEPIKGEMLLARVGGSPLKHDVTWDDSGVYSHDDDHVWLGGTEEQAGFDDAPSERGRAAVLARAARIMPGIEHASIVRHIAGLRPVTSDHLPIVGLAPGCDNIFLTLGGGRKGMLLGSAMGQAAVDHCVEGRTSLAIGACSPHRFQRPAVEILTREMHRSDHARPRMTMRHTSFRSRCIGCSREWNAEFVPVCPGCDGLVEVEFDLASATLRDSSNPYLRFFDLIPVHDPGQLPASAQCTPTVHATRLGEELGLPWLYLKNETVLPTGSTKDRMAAVALAFMHECGVRGFCASSTGNSSTAFAHALSAFPGMRMSLFTASSFRDRVHCPNERQIDHYILRDGTFVDAANFANTHAARHGLVAERGFFNPGRREGLKLAFLEAVDQIPRPIDWYVQAVSSAMGVMGTYKGARELTAMGRIDHPPRLLCVQQETCAPMATAWQENADVIQSHHIVAHPTGIAKAILRGNPTGAYPHVRRIVKDSGGTFEAVGESEIREARHMVRELEGVDACFSASTAVAGLIKMARNDRMPREHTVMINLTGRDRAAQESTSHMHWLVHRDHDWVPLETAEALVTS